MEINKFPLDHAIALSIATLKRSPSCEKTRKALLNYYCLNGDWVKAFTQITILTQLSAEYAREGELFKNLILAENMRESVLKGEKRPGSLNEDLPDWCVTLHRANETYGKGDVEQGEAMRQQAMASANPQRGSFGSGIDFNWLIDGDDRLGPVCEFICSGGYRWVPFEMIQSVKISPPSVKMDLIWATAELKVNDVSWFGYIPARYPVSNLDDEMVKSAAKTTWSQESGGRYCGHGQKMWFTDIGDYALFESGEMAFGE